jgi:hypothetical protein
MAAQHFLCIQCHKKYATHQKVFETLYDFQEMAPEECPACGGMQELHITLDFQLGGGEGDFKVVSALLPDKLESWLGEEEEEVTSYPFLLTLQRAGDHKEFCWMPFWLVTGKEARYVQHAVCMGQAQFESLIAQVLEKQLRKTRSQECSSPCRWS